MDPLDVFNIDLSGVETDRPVLRPGKYRVTLVRYNVKRNEEKQNSRLMLSFALDQEAFGINGEPISPGFVVLDSINRFDRSVAQRDENKAKANEIGEQTLARLVVAAGLPKGVFNPEALIGKQLTIKVDVDYSAEYGAQNRIKGYFKNE